MKIALEDEENALRLVGYGLCSEEDLIWSRANRVRLVAVDEVEEDKLHMYRVPVPEAFLTAKGKRGITVALAYDPPVRSSRREYLARTMWFEVLHGLTTDEVQEYRAQYNRAQYKDKEPPKLPSGSQIDFRPPKTKLQWSTLQVRSRQWKSRPHFRVPNGEEEPVLHLLVGCQQRFQTGLDPKQRYGVAVLFWHEGEHVELYQALQNRIRIPVTRIRVET